MTIFFSVIAFLRARGAKFLYVYSIFEVEMAEENLKRCSLSIISRVWDTARSCNKLYLCSTYNIDPFDFRNAAVLTARALVASYAPTRVPASALSRRLRAQHEQYYFVCRNIDTWDAAGRGVESKGSRYQAHARGAARQAGVQLCR